MSSISGAQALKLIRVIDDNVAFFDKKTKSLSSSLSQLKAAIEKCVKVTNEIESFASEYDFDEYSTGNGYRSFVSVTESAIEKSNILLRQLIAARDSFFFSADNFNKYNGQSANTRPTYSSFVFIYSEIRDLTEIFAGLSKICEALVELHQSNDDANLYNETKSFDNLITKTMQQIDQKAFYGRSLGFQFVKSLWPVMKLVVVLMASYFNFYFHDTKTKPLKFFEFAKSFVRFLMLPEKRAEKYLQACRNATTEFCSVSIDRFSIDEMLKSLFNHSLCGA